MSSRRSTHSLSQRAIDEEVARRVGGLLRQSHQSDEGGIRGTSQRGSAYSFGSGYPENPFRDEQRVPRPASSVYNTITPVPSISEILSPPRRAHSSASRSRYEPVSARGPASQSGRVDRQLSYAKAPSVVSYAPSIVSYAPSRADSAASRPSSNRASSQREVEGIARSQSQRESSEARVPTNVTGKSDGPKRTVVSRDANGNLQLERKRMVVQEPPKKSVKFAGEVVKYILGQ